MCGTFFIFLPEMLLIVFEIQFSVFFFFILGNKFPKFCLAFLENGFMTDTNYKVTF